MCKLFLNIRIISLEELVKLSGTSSVAVGLGLCDRLSFDCIHTYVTLLLPA